MKNFEVSISYAGHRYRVKGSYSPFVPAKTNCAPEDSHPAEGGIEEITSVELIDQSGLPMKLPDFLQDELDLHFKDNETTDDKIWEAITEADEDA